MNFLFYDKTVLDVPLTPERMGNRKNREERKMRLSEHSTSPALKGGFEPHVGCKQRSRCEHLAVEIGALSHV